MPIIIAPSILTADFANLGDQITQAMDAGAGYIHIDVMDGHFVPNLTIGPLIVGSLYPLTSPRGVVLDVHLMVEHPEILLESFTRAGAGILTVHVETCPHLHRTIQIIKALGVKAGVTLNPATPLNTLEEVLPAVDQILLMSVTPGFGGQSFIHETLNKIERLKSMLDERGLSHIPIEVDGGINPSNALSVVQAGASVLVVGSAIFNQRASIQENMIALWTSLQKTTGKKDYG